MYLLAHISARLEKDSLYPCFISTKVISRLEALDAEGTLDRLLTDHERLKSVLLENAWWTDEKLDEIRLKASDKTTEQVSYF